jgi:hypothetical protein
MRQLTNPNVFKKDGSIQTLVFSQSHGLTRMDIIESISNKVLTLLNLYPEHDSLRELNVRITHLCSLICKSYLSDQQAVISEEMLLDCTLIQTLITQVKKTQPKAVTEEVEDAKLEIENFRDDIDILQKDRFVKCTNIMPLTFYAFAEMFRKIYNKEYGSKLYKITFTEDTDFIQPHIFLYLLFIDVCVSKKGLASLDCFKTMSLADRTPFQRLQEMVDQKKSKEEALTLLECPEACKVLCKLQTMVMLRSEDYNVFLFMIQNMLLEFNPRIACNDEHRVRILCLSYAFDKAVEFLFKQKNLTLDDPECHYLYVHILFYALFLDREWVLKILESVKPENKKKIMRALAIECIKKDMHPNIALKMLRDSQVSHDLKGEIEDKINKRLYMSALFYVLAQTQSETKKEFLDKILHHLKSDKKYSISSQICYFALRCDRGFGLEIIKLGIKQILPIYTEKGSKTKLIEIFKVFCKYNSSLCLSSLYLLPEEHQAQVFETLIPILFKNDPIRAIEICKHFNNDLLKVVYKALLEENDLQNLVSILLANENLTSQFKYLKDFKESKLVDPQDLLNVIREHYKKTYSPVCFAYLYIETRDSDLLNNIENKVSFLIKVLNALGLDENELIPIDIYLGLLKLIDITNIPNPQVIPYQVAIKSILTELFKISKPYLLEGNETFENVLLVLVSHLKKDDPTHIDYLLNIVHENSQVSSDIYLDKEINVQAVVESIPAMRLHRFLDNILCHIANLCIEVGIVEFEYITAFIHEKNKNSQRISTGLLQAFIKYFYIKASEFALSFVNKFSEDPFVFPQVMISYIIQQITYKDNPIEAWSLFESKCPQYRFTLEETFRIYCTYFKKYPTNVIIILKDINNIKSLTLKKQLILHLVIQIDKTQYPDFIENLRAHVDNEILDEIKTYL